MKFSTSVKIQFWQAIHSLGQMYPGMTLLDVMMSWRNPNPQLPELSEGCKDSVNYGSYLIEENPGISTIPLLILPHVRIKL